MLDGVYRLTDVGPVFQAVPAPTAEQLQTLLTRIINRLLKGLTRKGALMEEALLCYGTPEIFNTDQGAQYTSEVFTAVLKAHEVKISMDGKCRWVENLFVEPLWRSVKYKDIYLRAYATPAAFRTGLIHYFSFYNTKRRHKALNPQTPDAVYWVNPKAKKAA